jgi:hypothetical protein
MHGFNIWAIETSARQGQGQDCASLDLGDERVSAIAIHEFIEYYSRYPNRFRYEQKKIINGL